MRPGKNRDGYFTNEDILDQFQDMVEIAKIISPHDNHISIYNNASTHLKRRGNALSAWKMPFRTPKPGKNWLVEVSELGPDRRTMRNPDGTAQKVKVQMENSFINGHYQPLYFPEGHSHVGVFKGMAVILEEQGYNVKEKRAACGGTKFNCTPGVIDCCCCCMLFNEPDFVNVKSHLEELADELGVHVVFLLRFHCELNPIEQCWGYAKRVYHLFPASS
jgi:hypothetical protein